MNFNEYRKRTHETCLDNCFNEDYLTLGLLSEIGELAGKFKRVIRDNVPAIKENILPELGDILWYTVELCNLHNKYTDHKYFPTSPKFKNSKLNSKEMIFEFCKQALHMKYSKYKKGIVLIFSMIDAIALEFGSTIEEVADWNINKLADRKLRNKLHGSGDYR